MRDFLEEFQDHLAPKLDTYEQAIYLYLFRHSRLIGKDEITVGFKSARKRMAFGVGEHGKAMAEGTCYKKLRSLKKKGCVEILDSVRDGTRIRLKLPSEIPGVVRLEVAEPPPDLENLDFFHVLGNRLAILKREGGRCFYCFRAIEGSNFVIEHVLPDQRDNHSYRNLVAACRNCNNRKGKGLAEDYLRSLYRDGFLSDSELHDRLAFLQRLLAGELRPELPV
jgi:hypothetical protein